MELMWVVLPSSTIHHKLHEESGIHAGFGRGNCWLLQCVLELEIKNKYI